MNSLGLGLSPCPNDTYIFDALIHGRIALEDRFSPRLADVQDLNDLAGSGFLELTKLSLAAMIRVLDRYVILDAGAALGRGCGPLLVSRAALSPEECRTASLAIPGRLTTANALLDLSGLFHGPRLEMPFETVIPAVAAGRTDLGAVIHEGRFTYAAHGLRLVLDLGRWWEESARLPLPLGVIAARRDLGKATILRLEDAVRRSLEHARARPEDSRAFVAAHAQEMDPEVREKHIAMFVNDFSLSLGQEGQKAVRALLEAAAASAGLALPDLALFAAEL
ncbi:MAG: 1,4-dihydroxy-6-naphthoate synthase [Deltaproteobacteria bacterium]|nr:1,4-dihydroxy-6-naphthoate synthase [Deltaproteobacteria bacterium]